MFQVQAGMFDPRIMNQTTYWINHDAQILAIDEMTTEHIANVIAMLENDPNHYYFAALIDALIELADSLMGGRQSGEVLAYQLTGHSLSDATPEQWLQSTPLMRHLRQILKRRAS